MGIFKRIGQVLGGGGAPEAAGALIGQADEIVSRYAPGITGKDEMVKELLELGQAGYESARAHDQPQNSGIKIVDALVNGVNRLIRPGITVGLIGGLFNWWALPSPDSMDDRYWDLLQIVLVFWFGGRAIFSDLPKAVSYLGGLRRLPKGEK
jgi:hypothetical protein